MKGTKLFFFSRFKSELTRIQLDFQNSNQNFGTLIKHGNVQPKMRMTQCNKLCDIIESTMHLLGGGSEHADQNKKAHSGYVCVPTSL